MNQLKTKIFIVFSFCLFMPNLLQADMTTDTCSACHVMHASEVGLGVLDGTYTPREALLKTGCEGCHTEASGESIGPAVYMSSTDLAGGDFEYSDSDERKGHNPYEISTLDTLTEPPGWKSGLTDSENNQVAGSGWAEDKLSCAGSFGCHGNHSVANSVLSLQKAHHNNTNDLVDPVSPGSTVGGSFRFLHGIKGYEDPDWQDSVGAGDHNVYFDEARSGLETIGDRVSSKQTISYFCALCHGIFHSGNLAEGLLDNAGDEMFTDPWIRHPVSIDMPVSGDYAAYTSFTDSAPVASTTVKDAGDHDTDIGAAANRIVICLSCHRAHASNYYGSIRWDYRGTPGSSVNGCSVCHSSKN